MNRALIFLREKAVDVRPERGARVVVSGRRDDEGQKLATELRVLKGKRKGVNGRSLRAIWRRGIMRRIDVASSRC